MKRLLTFWSLFWTIALAGILASNTSHKNKRLPHLEEVVGIVESTRKFKNSQNADRPHGDPSERFQYESKIRYGANKLWTITGDRPLTEDPGDPIKLLISKTDPSERYIKSVYLAKSSKIVFFVGWLFLAGFPWPICALLGFFRPEHEQPKYTG